MHGQSNAKRGMQTGGWRLQTRLPQNIPKCNDSCVKNDPSRHLGPHRSSHPTSATAQISQWCSIETRHPWQRPSRVVKNPRNSRCARIHMRCVRHVFHVLLLEVVDCQGLSLLSIHKISWKIWWLPSDLLERNNNIDDVNKNRFSASIHYPLVN